MPFLIRIDAAMAKALNTSRLVKKKISVNRGGKIVEQMRWVRPDEAPGPGRAAAAPEEPKLVVRRQEPQAGEKRGAAEGYGMHNIERGDSIEFSAGGATMSGVVTDDTRHDGLIVRTPDGKKHPVAWKDITNFTGNKAKPNPLDTPKVTGPRDPVDPDKFEAHTWKKDHDDPDATPEGILSEMEKAHPGVKDSIAKTEERLKTLEQTISNHRVSGQDASSVYSPERMALHKKIIMKFMSPEKVRAAKPAEGEKPTFTILGGRGGSGKSWFKGNVYDEDKSIVLDADAIKGELPEYEGFNAAQVHEESSDILEKMLHVARANGLNVVLDATMKTTNGAIKKVQGFKDAGYAVEAHYMHLPRQEAAKRAVGRFMGKEGRYVPVQVVLSNTTNEDTFDKVKDLADAWSFRDNNVGRGEAPILISEKPRASASESKAKAQEGVAPNGKPSKLSPEQWKAVRTPEFKSWFGDWEKDPKNASKVMDENGEPLVQYHWRDEALSDDTFYDKGFGIHFGSVDAASDRKKHVEAMFSRNNKGAPDSHTYPVFLNIRNPVSVEDYSSSNLQDLAYELNDKEVVDSSVVSNVMGSVDADSEDYGLGRQGQILKQALLGKGVDGLRYGNVVEDKGNESWVAFNSSQIKSATGNSKFDPAHPSINKALRLGVKIRGFFSHG